MDLIQSLAMAEALTQTLKYNETERPDGSGKNSFPSGHAADTFAFATALERHMGWRYAIPAYTFRPTSPSPDCRRIAIGSAMRCSARRWGSLPGRTITSHEAHPFPVTVNYVQAGSRSCAFVVTNSRSTLK